MGITKVSLRLAALGLAGMVTVGCSDNNPEVQSRSPSSSAPQSTNNGSQNRNPDTYTGNTGTQNTTTPPVTNYQPPILNTTTGTTNPPVVAQPGVCGSAANTYPDPLVGPSNSALCAQGTAVGFAGSGPWSWTCQSSGGNASCSTLPCAVEMSAVGVVNVSWVCSEYQRMYGRLPDIGGALYWDVNLSKFPISCRDTAFLAGTIGTDCSRYLTLYGQVAPASACGGVQPTSCP